jgi:aspartate ammonia-lyase
VDTSQADIRLETDLLGRREVGATARYGVHSLRATENFARPRAQRLSDVPEFCGALGMVKLAAQRANLASGSLDPGVANAIGTAAEDLIADRHGLRSDLIVPLVQGGAGTSTNMNVNEVIANRALELLGFAYGDYDHCHPNDHVNRSQSTNDVYPTALRLALIRRSWWLETAADRLEAELRAVARQHDETRKLGRTQLQDAIAMTVGQEFDAWADAIASSRSMLESQREGLLEVNLGGTAIGNGLTASAEYRERVVPMLAEITGLPLSRAVRPVSATTDTAALLGYSGALRGVALALAKIANDLRLLSSGPFGGLDEIRLPAVQGGSSMMPGKVNPVIPEFVNQLAFRARGRDVAVTSALDAGQLQLNAMLPVVASELFHGQEDMRYAMDALRMLCIAGATVNEHRAAQLAEHELGDLSCIAVEEGYARATQAANLLPRGTHGAQALDRELLDPVVADQPHPGTRRGEQCPS